MFVHVRIESDKGTVHIACMRVCSSASMADVSKTCAARTCGSGCPNVFSEMPSRAARGMTVLSNMPCIRTFSNAMQLQAAVCTSAVVRRLYQQRRGDCDRAPSLAFCSALTLCSHVVSRLENAVFSSNTAQMAHHLPVSVKRANPVHCSLSCATRMSCLTRHGGEGVRKTCINTQCQTCRRRPLFWQRVALTGANWRPVAVQHQQLCTRTTTKAWYEALEQQVHEEPRLM